MVSGRSLPRELGVFISLAGVAIGFQIFSHGNFFNIETWNGIFSYAAEIGVVALGVTLLMIAGEFDLSVGSNFAFSGMLFAMATISWGWAPASAFVLALASGSIIGWINGLVTVYTGIPSFITTLGALLVWRGLVLAMSQGWPLTLTGDSPAFLNYLTHPSIWILLSISALVFLTRTRFGNWISATGGTPLAARACGVPTARVKILSFALTGFLAALAGSMQFSRLGSFSPTYGEGLELEAIAACVIGGTALAGGSGGVLGTVLGTLLMAMISSGLVLSGAPVYWLRTFVGLILVGSVILNRALTGRMVNT